MMRSSVLLASVGSSTTRVCKAAEGILVFNVVLVLHLKSLVSDGFDLKNYIMFRKGLIRDGLLYIYSIADTNDYVICVIIPATIHAHAGCID